MVHVVIKTYKHELHSATLKWHVEESSPLLVTCSYQSLPRSYLWCEKLVHVETLCVCTLVMLLHHTLVSPNGALWCCYIHYILTPCSCVVEWCFMGSVSDVATGWAKCSSSTSKCSVTPYLGPIDPFLKVCNLTWSLNSNEVVSTHGFSHSQAQNQICIWVGHIALLRTLFTWSCNSATRP